jgi:3D (Asp-Asp-Asp) domain-containing protein
MRWAAAWRAGVLSLVSMMIVAAVGNGATDASLRLRATEYYTAIETDYPAGADSAFTAPDGRVLHRGSREFVDAATIEGSARFRDGTLLNLTGDGTSHWRVTDTPYGLATNDCPLVPLRTAAVDPSVVPLGSRIRIPETIGMPLPGGGKHDGIWWATDTGPQISGHRVDLFMGAGVASMAQAERFGIRNLQPLTVEILGANAGCGS